MKSAVSDVSGRLIMDQRLPVKRLIYGRKGAGKAASDPAPIVQPAE